MFIDPCPSRKCPFTWTMEAGKGKQGSMGGSHTSSTLGKRPASRDRGPSHCASWGGFGQWARALAREDSSEGFQPRLKASLRRTQPHGRYNQGNFLRSDFIHARGSLGRIVLNTETRTCYLINSQACEIGAWVRKPKHERNLSIVSQRLLSVVDRILTPVSGSRCCL